MRKIEYLKPVMFTVEMEDCIMNITSNSQTGSIEVDFGGDAVPESGDIDFNSKARNGGISWSAIDED